MTNCGLCKYAILDYESYYGTIHREWFVTGCKKDLEESEDCEGYEEWEDDDDHLCRFWDDHDRSCSLGNYPCTDNYDCDDFD